MHFIALFVYHILFFGITTTQQELLASGVSPEVDSCTRVIKWWLQTMLSLHPYGLNIPSWKLILFTCLIAGTHLVNILANDSLRANFTMSNQSELKFVWPKDGYKGRSGHRGFWGRLNNILTNKGPDVFIQKKKDRRGINPEWWGNWYWNSWRRTQRKWLVLISL